MNQELYDRVYEVFIGACGLILAELGPFLDQACAGRPDVRAEVEALLGHVTDAPLIEPAAPPSDPLRLVGEVLMGRHHVESHVAEGGFSHVYRGFDARAERPVALKVFKDALATRDRADLLASFAREGPLLASLARETDGVVRALEVGIWTDRRGRELTCIALEWLDGQTLAAHTRANRRAWPLEEVLDLLDPVARALAAAHRAGIAHRDVKPDNIYVLRGEPSRAKLLDFGVAKIAALHSRGFESTSSAISPFTVGYAAPEQVSQRFGPTGPRTDVHALALVCVELLAGRPAHGHATTREALAQVLSKKRPTPRALGSSVASAVEAVFARALALEPSARPADAGALWEALRTAARPRPARFWR